MKKGDRHLFRKQTSRKGDKYIYFPLLLILALLSLFLPANLWAQTSDDTLYNQLTSTPHRLAGSPEGTQAGDAILDSLSKQGIPQDWIAIQPFPVTQLKIGPGGCLAQTPTGNIPLSPIRPNLLIPSAIPAPGLTAQVVDLGNCDWPQFIQPLNGKIALIGQDAGPRFKRAIDMGASALLFERSPSLSDPGNESWFNANINIPRFAILPQHAQSLRKLTNQPITLISDLHYTTSLARNILVTIPAQADSKLPKTESILLMAAYDSYGPTPFHAPATQQAANAASLVQAAGSLKAHPPARQITLAFLDNNAQAQSGQLWLQWAKSTGPDGIAQLIKERQLDRQWTAKMIEALADPIAVVSSTNASPIQTQARKHLTDESEWQNAQLVAELSQARIDNLARDRKARAQDTSPAAVALRAQIKSLESQHDTLNRARRLLATGTLSQTSDENALLLDLIAQAKARFTQRLVELDVQLQWLADSQALSARLSKTRTVMAVYFNLPTSPWPAVVSTPTPAVSGFVVNQQARKTLADLLISHGNLQVLDISPAGAPWSVTARSTWAIEIGSNPNEPPSQAPVSNDFSARFSDALGLACVLAQSPELSQVRTPGRSPNLVFNIPRMTEPGRYSGSLVRYYDDQTKLGRPSPGAVVAIRPRRPSPEPADPSDRSFTALTTSDQTGAFWLMTAAADNTAITCHAASFDPSGTLQRISQFNPTGERGTTANWESASWYLARDPIQLPIFLVRHQGLIAGLQALTGPMAGAQANLLDARSQSSMHEVSATTDAGLLCVYAGKTQNLKLLSSPFRLINSQPDEPLGDGYLITPKTLDALSTGAQDLWTLNDSRLDRLRRNGIDLPWIERQHAAAQGLMEDAAQSPAPGASRALNTLSLGYSNRVYQPVRDVTNDLIKSVVVLLLLAVPFAYALERLIVGAGNVYGQIIGFSVIFSATFALLYWVHPAFRFAGYPLIVLLAFLIIVMSALVIWIMWSKFEYEMRRLHGVATQSHQSTRDARATVGAAIAQGIATMKRRPLKTGLTLLTIAILTFTVLFFGAFSSEPAIRWITLGVDPGPAQICVRPAPTAPWPTQTLEPFAARWAGQAEVYRRAWAVSPAGAYMTGRTPDGQPFKARAWVTLPKQDIKSLPGLAQSLSQPPQSSLLGSLYLPTPVPKELIGQTCTFEGLPYTLAGSFDPAKLSALKTADGAPLLALDTAELRRKIEQEVTRDPETVNQRMAQLDASEYPTIDAADTVLITDVPGASPRDNIQALVIAPLPSADPKAIAAELTLMMDRPVFIVADSLAQRAVFSSTMQLGGLAVIAVPLLLGSLLVFSSMMSSVADREREIFTFSALGLAPRHIALLFFAEAGVYGLVGAMSGYLGAQVFAKAAGLLGRLGYMETPALNYSSTNAVLTLLVVIAAVVISTIYPAFKASRSANPGIQRSWKMPAPVGDTLQLEFPFTVSHDDMTGLVSYLHEYFSQHKDRSIGGFAAAQVTMSQSQTGFSLTAQVWLQPFDQGVSQSFHLSTQPSDIPGIDRVLLVMTRTSGNPAMWARANKLFIALLRQQFLLWRTLPDDTIDHYHALTIAQLGLAPESENHPATPAGAAHAS